MKEEGKPPVQINEYKGHRNLASLLHYFGGLEGRLSCFRLLVQYQSYLRRTAHEAALGDAFRQVGLAGEYEESFRLLTVALRLDINVTGRKH